MQYFSVRHHKIPSYTSLDDIDLMVATLKAQPSVLTARVTRNVSDDIQITIVQMTDNPDAAEGSKLYEPTVDKTGKLEFTEVI